MTSIALSLLAEAIQPAAGRGGWHGGPTPLGALRGVTVAQACWTPTPQRKSIWALTLHIAYWKYAVRRLLEGGPRGGFPRQPSNWPAPPEHLDARHWAADVAVLREAHERLILIVAELSPRLLTRRVPTGKRWSYGELVVGIAAHDAYHTGQIQLMKRLWQERNVLRDR